MSKKKWLSALTAAAMVLALLPSTVFAAGGEENGNLVIGGKTYEPVSADRLTVSVVNGVEAKVENGFVDYTVSDSADKSDWDQNSGVGSVQTYTYVGLYVNIPDGATTLKMDDEGNPADVAVVDGAFLQGGKFQQ